MGMTLLQEYETRVDCDDHHCSLRYYIKGEPLCIGYIKLVYTHSGGINGTVVTVSEWSVGDMIRDISDNHSLSPTEMESIMTDIRRHAVSTVKDHLTRGKI